MQVEVLHAPLENRDLDVFLYDLKLFDTGIRLFLNENRTRLHKETCKKQIYRICLFFTNDEYRHTRLRAGLDQNLF